MVFVQHKNFFVRKARRRVGRVVANVKTSVSEIKIFFANMAQNSPKFITSLLWDKQIILQIRYISDLNVVYVCKYYSTFNQYNVKGMVSFLKYIQGH